MRVVFGVLSSVNTAQAIEQICAAVGNKHVVLVHHDYSKKPEFSLSSSNARVIEDPVATDWGKWGVSEAILKTMSEAQRGFEFDYFQLLSDSCLPIKPIEKFEEFLERERPDASLEALPVSIDDPLPLLNYGYCFYPRNRLEKTLMRRLAKVVLTPADENRSRLERGGLALDQPRDPNLATKAASFLHELLATNAQKSLPLNGGPIFCGSTWFGVSRQVLARMLAEHRRSPGLANHFRRNAQIADEGYFPTLIMGLKPGRVLGFNHHVRWTQRRTGPDELSASDIGQLRDSSKFFARKFPKDPNSEVRRLVLSKLLTISGDKGRS